MFNDAQPYAFLACRRIHYQTPCIHRIFKYGFFRIDEVKLADSINQDHQNDRVCVCVCVCVYTIRYVLCVITLSIKIS